MLQFFDEMSLSAFVRDQQDGGDMNGLEQDDKKNIC